MSELKAVTVLQRAICLLLMNDGMSKRASLIAAVEIIELVAESGLSPDIKTALSPENWD
jgi:hypothetical protein